MSHTYLRGLVREAIGSAYNARVAGIVAVLALAAAAPLCAGTDGQKDILRVDRSAATTETGKYPPEYIVKTKPAFDGSYSQAVLYTSLDKKFEVDIWQSGPGTFTVQDYPHDEYCMVLEGHLITTTKDGHKQSFGPGDSFVIPKGWAGTWNMTDHFKKEGVNVYQTPQQ